MISGEIIEQAGRRLAAAARQPARVAVLASREIEYGKTHQLHYLIRLLEENEVNAPASVLDAVELNPWAVEFRYEDDDEPPLDRHATLAFVEEIRRWAEKAVER